MWFFSWFILSSLKFWLFMWSFELIGNPKLWYFTVFELIYTSNFWFLMTIFELIGSSGFWYFLTWFLSWLAARNSGTWLFFSWFIARNSGILWFDFWVDWQLEILVFKIFELICSPDFWYFMIWFLSWLAARNSGVSWCDFWVEAARNSGILWCDFSVDWQLGILVFSFFLFNL